RNTTHASRSCSMHGSARVLAADGHSTGFHRTVWKLHKSRGFHALDFASRTSAITIRFAWKTRAFGVFSRVILARVGTKRSLVQIQSARHPQVTPDGSLAVFCWSCLRSTDVPAGFRRGLSQPVSTPSNPPARSP